MAEERGLKLQRHSLGKLALEGMEPQVWTQGCLEIWWLGDVGGDQVGGAVLARTVQAARCWTLAAAAAAVASTEVADLSKRQSRLEQRMRLLSYS